jgi:glycosyltransferase involved in cell wall biosynthesis
LSGTLTVAAALIVRNEEHFLTGCLQSLRGRVDEIIVVDTGSEDASIDIARNAEAVVLHHEWDQDFAAARNAGLEAVTCDWVLYIDADERLHLPRGGAVADYLDASAIAAYVHFRPKSGYTRYRESRLFRNDRRLRFAGRIHETFVPLLREISARENLPIVQSEVEIDHLGYDGDQSEKHARNLPLLQAAVRANPDRVYYWYHLAETLAALGRAEEALDVAREGLASAERDPTEKQIADASVVIQTIARLELERGRNPLPLIENGLARLPDDYGLLFFYGRALLAAGRPHDALEVAGRLRKVDPDQLTPGLLAFDRGIFDEKACELMALAGLQIARKGQYPVRPSGS